MRQRLEELNWRTQAHSPNESTGVFNSEHREVISTTVSLRAKKKKTA